MKNPKAVLSDTQGWNEYWTKKSRKGGLIYELIAEFYRKVIIRPSLNHFLRKYFRKGAKLLHAGCGSGQVDRDVRYDYQITGLDISQEALNIYQKENGQLCESIRGSIFEAPFQKDTFEGIYNLGVMEHFSKDDIQRILNDFHRILKASGRLVVLWPPEFGLSVIFFKVLKASLEFIFRREFKFHPDEISRIPSRRWVVQLFESNRFEVLEYSFGMRDLFTYSVIVAQKKS